LFVLCLFAELRTGSVSTMDSKVFSVNSLVGIIESLEKRDEDVISKFPELNGMLEISDAQRSVLSIEHCPEDNPLWVHLKTVISRKLAGVDSGVIEVFQSDQAMDEKSFSSLVSLYREVCSIHDLGVCLNAALLFSDISKGSWVQKKYVNGKDDIDLSVHNEASAGVLLKEGTLRRLGLDGLCERIVSGLVCSHGFIGQFVRGEATYHAFSSYRQFLTDVVSDFAQKYLSGDSEKAAEMICHAYLLLNVLDTAGVREGLMTSELFARFLSVDLMGIYHGEHVSPFDDQVNKRIEAMGKDIKDSKLRKMLYVVARLEHLRQGRRAAGEPENEVLERVMELNEKEVTWFEDHFESCQLWYCESALGDLSVPAQMKVIAIGMHLWEKSVHYRDDEAYNVDLLPVARILSPHAKAPTPQLALSRSHYRKRLLEAILSDQNLSSIIDGSSVVYGGDVMFGVEGKRGCRQSVSIDVRESEEATALITLLSIYERKSSVSYHSALKLLCDLYHLRKDDFDRLANEAQYLSAMNSAKSDKERMLRWLHTGKIVEIGPGGGVVLDLLEHKFPDAEIYGIDLSHQVVSALQQKKHSQQSSWNIIEGNAFELPVYFSKESLDGVVFCSILHEIYSYVERDDGSRFHLESVRDMLKSAFDTLKPGGRIVIRDGIMPPHEPRLLRFCCDDAKEFFDAFCREFKGRSIEYKFVEPDLVSLDSADAMEFMYTYNWGPDSFPYEVREQYGVLTYKDYCQHILEWLGGEAKILPVPDDEAQYVQPGYVKSLKDRLALMDGDGNPVGFPATNAIIVIEKAL